MSMNLTFSTDQNFVNNSKPQLKGGDIYKVIFKSAEYETFEGKKDETKGQTFNVFKISFENEEGYYAETIFEPRDDDYKRRESDFNGQKIINPARLEEIQLIVAQLVEAVNPGGMAKLAGKNIPDFKTLCAYITKLTKEHVDTEVELKLILDKKGKARLPFLAALNKEGKLYPKTNYVGKDLYFTDKEVADINKIKSAAPTDTTKLLAEKQQEYEAGGTSIDDLNLELD